MRTKSLDPRVDVVFKLLFGAKHCQDILIALLTAVLQPPFPILSVEVLNPEVPKVNVGDKGIFLDLCVRMANGSVVDLEMQFAKVLALRERILYYWARTYGAQLQRGDDYTSLRRVVSILFLDDIEMPAASFHSVFRIQEIHTHMDFSAMLEIHTVELPKLKGLSAQDVARDGKLAAWGRFLTAENDAQVAEAAMVDPMINKAQEELELLSSDPVVRRQAEDRRAGRFFYRMELDMSRKEGREEGLQHGMQRAVLAVLEARGLEAPPHIQDLILACHDAQKLALLVKHAAQVGSALELFPSQ